VRGLFAKVIDQTLTTTTRRESLEAMIRPYAAGLDKSRRVVSGQSEAFAAFRVAPDEVAGLLCNEEDALSRDGIDVASLYVTVFQFRDRRSRDEALCLVRGETRRG